MKSRSFGLEWWRRELRREPAWSIQLHCSSMEGHLCDSATFLSDPATNTYPATEVQLSFGRRGSNWGGSQCTKHELSSKIFLLAPIDHGIGTCAHLRSYEIHHMGGADPFKPDSRRINECITTKRTASVKCLHPEQQIQSEILSATPTTSTSEGIRHEARDCHVMAAGLCKALGVAWEKESSADRNFPFKWAPTSVLSKLQSRVCCMYRSSRWELTRQEQLTVRSFTNQTLDT
jgi:hypothetical protein